MTSALRLLAVCCLVASVGCLGAPGTAPSTADAPTDSVSATPTVTQTATPTPSVSNEAAGERSIAAEKDRIERVAADDDTLTGLAFGILRPADSEVVERNGTGVVVRVRVGYSVSFDCDDDGEPESSADGAYTEATYLVTETGTELQSITQGFLPSGGHC